MISMASGWFRFWQAGWLGICVLPLLAAAQPEQPRPLPRALPPAFEGGELEGVFFENLFEQALVGPRPAAPPANETPPVPPGAGLTAREPAAGAASAPGTAGWSRLVSAATLEDEVKRRKIVVDQSILSPTRFRSRDYRTCRREFSLLAMLFGIIEQYDGDIRWQQDAGSLRQAFARAAKNCKSGSEQVFNEARQRKADLQDAVGGGAVGLPAATARQNWEDVCDRGPLMQRLEIGERDVLRPLTADAAEFSGNLDRLLHEAEIVAAIGQVLQREGMRDAGDEDYDGFAARMTRAALELVQAVQRQNLEAAGQASRRISESCNACHELYRG